MNPRVSVVIPTHDRPDALRRCVKSLLAQRPRPAEIIIVNDGEADVPTDVVTAAEDAGVPPKRVRRLMPCLPASRNRGVDAAGGDVVLMLDDDVRLRAGTLARLTEFYDADEGGVVAGIGLTPVEPGDGRATARLWRALTTALGQDSWRPRVQCARYVCLPARLRGGLVPAPRFNGCAFSLRADVARRWRFREAFCGYAYGEDREYSYRVGRWCSLFAAPRLRVDHDVAPGGRGDWTARGRAYLANGLATIRSATEGGAGAWLLAGYDFAGMALLYAAWGVATASRDHLRFAAGLAGEAVRRALTAGREMLCGS